ncbi:Arc family DNA-binding protein [Candidatus Symbiopectobacterium sp. NZEC127]|uniref:Arc family DNA-binding protein n=1 Tax=Candidatus Symbiopectobacterium sp. NZEC127 TaxID=2820472 RepID=UPI00222627CC|nr:Arc family DNA-binding protein [Candidatus Symbiopectobacterium sp. NZEC127]MCW2484859.1 Arc family DNA-binding protein [Candidatus Symbiopectobacterium sp. NZEC127]
MDKNESKVSKMAAITLRMPGNIKAEVKKRAEADGLSLNSAIVQRLARSLREEEVNDR